uniref:virulence factor TspB C-terminal domain-related protein n=1 Tax=Neisseria sicca TaxID=490 RepID=UPI0026ED9E11
KGDSPNSGQGNSKDKKSDSPSRGSKGSKKADSDGNSGGSADGNGDGSGSEQYGLPDVPDVPDGGGEPDWGGIKSDGNFGTFSPSSAFATGGQCPQDILLDFGQFGRHSFSWSPICEAAQRLRYVFITLAYFMAAMMVYKTVNSMKG